jgi:1-deoxy-D-xylulose-5-phosphate reductoisomerase
MTQTINIFGSTGSIGDSALSVLSGHKDDFSIRLLAAGKNIKKLQTQIINHQPDYASIYDKNAEKILKAFLKENNLKTKFIPFKESLELNCDILLSAIVGSAGLLPTYKGIFHSKRIALANKESMVTAGELINKTCKKNNVEIIPVDSEHNAIHQCLRTGKSKEVKALILTASGGPFFKKNCNELKNVTVDDALNHPTWKMGSKITIDSATLMNKGLEVIEAHFLFNIGYENIKVKVHPQSIVHSMVEFIDGSIIAQMGITNMQLPINYALYYPKRIDYPNHIFDISGHFSLDFFDPDFTCFKCLNLAYTCGKKSTASRIILNGANEVAVSAFLNKKIKFLQIADFIDNMLNKIEEKTLNSIEDILEFDKIVKEKAKSEVTKCIF